MTLTVGGPAYVNIRERAAPMVCSGYEHLGVILDSPEAVEEVWSMLADDGRDVHLEELQRGEGGYRGFRFEHLLPLAIEVQYLP